jgi:putative hydrolase of the HAD superfamily
MRSCRSLSAKSKIPPDEIYNRVFQTGIEEDYDLGRISSEEFARRVIKVLGFEIAPDEVRDLWSDIFWPMEGMEELIRELKPEYRLVLLSNTNEWHFEHCLHNFPVLGLFDAWALSFQIGARKPDPAIFEKALDLAGVSPAESIFIDDIQTYVDAAARMGIESICFDSADQLKSDLLALGIRFAS